MLIWACVSLDWCFGLPPRRASRFRPRARPRPGCGAPTHLYSAERAVGDACVPRLRRVAPAQPLPLECFHSATCPQPLQANRRSAWGRRLQQRCVNRDKTSVFARSAAYTTHQLRRRGCRCVSSAPTNASATFFSPTCCRRKRAPTARFDDRQQAPSSLRPAVRRWQALRTRCVLRVGPSSAERAAR